MNHLNPFQRNSRTKIHSPPVQEALNPARSSKDDTKDTGKVKKLSFSLKALDTEFQGATDAFGFRKIYEDLVSGFWIVGRVCGLFWALMVFKFELGVGKLPGFTGLDWSKGVLFRAEVLQENYELKRLDSVTRKLISYNLTSKIDYYYFFNSV